LFFGGFLLAPGFDVGLDLLQEVGAVEFEGAEDVFFGAGQGQFF
jgi:hypothetical protein